MLLKIVLLALLLECFTSRAQNSTSGNICQLTLCPEQESKWLERLEKVINISKNGLDQLQRQLVISKKVLHIDSRENYLENLLNRFSLAHRLTKVWPLTISLMTNMFKKSVRTPDFHVDTEGLWVSALMAMIRLQQTYNISTDSLARGDLAGVYPHTNLTARDCLDIGVWYYDLHHHDRAVEWLLAALQKSPHDTSAPRQQVLEYLHLAQCFRGDSRGSLETLEMISEKFPRFNPSPELLEDHATVASQRCEDRANFIRENLLYNNTTDVHNVVEQKGLCRRETNQRPADSRLRCRLLHYHLPHLLISPFKMEELHLDPPILLVYDTIHDNEIDQFKTLFHNRTRPAEYDYTSEDDPYHDTQYLIWFPEFLRNLTATEAALTGKIAKRAARITNLSLFRAEATMLASYGVGAENKIHQDLGPYERIFARYSRSDYFTLMYYMNDVEEGGYTIFPNINLAVAPIKGAAVLWFNRFPDWSEVEAMEHSGCPVLRGNKWIITKWFHVLGQDFPKCLPGKETSFKYYYL